MQLAQQLVKDFPDDGFAYVSLGIAKLGSKEYRDSMTLMTKGIEINKKNLKEYSSNLERITPLWLGVAYLLNNDFDESKRVFEDNLKQPFAEKIMDYTGLVIANYKLSNSEEVFNNIIRIFELSGWTAESASKIAKNPKNMEPNKYNVNNISKVIVLNMHSKEYDRATELAKSLTTVDEYAGALMLGLVEIGQLKRDEAVNNFKIASKQRPYNIMAIWLLAMDNAALGDFDSFLKNLYSAVTIGSTPERDPWQEAQQISNTLAISRYISSRW
jgi:tetratricopeptide (TPR) repeat protein